MFDDVVGGLRIPAGILTDEEWARSVELEKRDKERRNSQPPAKPERDSGDVSHDD